MATAFRPVNTNFASDYGHNKTTPRTTPQLANTDYLHSPRSEPSHTMDDSTTPTRASFGHGAMAAQKPLPTSPFPQAVQVPDSTEKLPRRENSQHSRKSRDSDDMHMDDSDAETGGADDAGSDDESVNADGTRSGKKKKSQRFYCTDYPPCSLSFTRSEHLARHIRKHTGERPFQCHCSRRFSRLDNLRQHAQTVHVNEDIPIDSLAATGTRFQRQIRTDRVRTTGRARASTAGSIGTPVRGHSKSLSTSSIASIGSVGSNYSPRDERRRPAPLVMASDPRSRLSMESQYSYRAVSPSDFSTPTSATFSTGPGSPRWASGMASPTSSHSRSQSMYASGTRTPGRRLSVPSSGNPFQSSPSGAVGRNIFGPGPLNSSNTAVFSSPNGSLLASPTTSTSGYSRRESMSSVADDAWRRRTWHPDSREFSAGGSRLSKVITPSQYDGSPTSLPIANPATQQTNLRLPGIESFDPIPRASPPRRAPSPMLIDSDGPQYSSAPMPAPGDSIPEDRRNAAQWEMGLHRGLNRLEIANTTPPRDSAGAWANEANRAVQAQAEQARAGQPTVRFESHAQVMRIPSSDAPREILPARGHAHTISAPVSSTPRDSKRHGWYHGPVTVHSSGEVGGDAPSRVARMVHPNASTFTGFPARVPQTVHEQQPLNTSDRPAEPDSMQRLQALVAVATSEGSTAKAY